MAWVMAQYTLASNVADIQTIQNPDTYDTALPPLPPAVRLQLLRLTM